MSRLRPLDLPRPIRVEANERGWPVRLASAKGPLATRPLVPSRAAGRPVAAVLDRWRIDDEWWRPVSISRMYFRVVLEGGQILTVFHDLIEGGWYLQTAATPIARAE